MTHQYTPLRPLATVQSWQAQLEANGANPKHTEPLTRGARVPASYQPSYTWTSVRQLALYDDDGNEIPILNPPSATLVMPELQNGHGNGWAQAQVITLEPGLVPADFDPTRALYFTDPMPMATGVAIADQVDAQGGPPRTDVIRIPRPLAGEQPTENGATWIVLAISDASQQNDFPQGTHWNNYLPKVERGDFVGIQHAIYALPSGANVSAQGPLITSVEDTVPNSLRAVPDLGDVVFTAPSALQRPRFDAQRAAMVFAPAPGSNHQLRQDASPLAQALDGVDTATLYCVAKFAQGAITECAWSVGATGPDYWSLWWAAGNIVGHRHSNDEANAPYAMTDFSVLVLRSQKSVAPELFIDGVASGTGTLGQDHSALAGGSAILGAFGTPDDVPGTGMVGEIAEWTLCLAAHTNQQIDTKSAYLRQYWQARGLVFNPLPPLPPLLGGP